MATASQRVQHLLSINRAWWLLDVKRHDPHISAKALNRYLKRKQASITDQTGGTSRRPMSRVNSLRIEWYDHVIFSQRNKSGRILALLTANSNSSNSNSSTQMIGTHCSIPSGSIGGKLVRRSKALISEHHILNNESIPQSHSHNSQHTALREAHHVNTNPSRLEKPQEPATSGGNDVDGNGKPSVDQLLKVYNTLQESLPKLFLQPMNYTIYRQDIIFINNLINKTTTGLFKYVQQVALLRTVGHLKYAYVRFELVSMSQDPEEGRITVRWRIAGISGLRVMLKFWKFKLWKYQEIMKQQETWHDGISYFDVGSDGLVYRHIADKVEEDKDRLLDEKRRLKAPLIAKLAIMASLFPRTGLPIHEAVAFQSSCSAGEGCVGQEVSSVNKDSLSLQSS